MKTSSLSTILSSLLAVVSCTAAQLDIKGPAGSGAFGTTVTRLANGNFVVTDPLYDAPGPVRDVGAVDLYDGKTFKRISRLTGSKADDKIGSLVFPLRNGNYVVCSQDWSKETGAATWCSGTKGINGVISEANSLVGSQQGDRVGTFIVMSFQTDAYAVVSPQWANGSQERAGALTWAPGPSGVKGRVSPQNSLVGTSEGDTVGVQVFELKGGQVVVTSALWSDMRGAVTWCPDFNGVKGPVSQSNSLVGDQPNGTMNTVPLETGHYVVANSTWSNGAIPTAGAVVWCDGKKGRKGVFSGKIGLAGDRANGRVGIWVTALRNGNYVVSSGFWPNDSPSSFGAATFCNGSRLTTAVVSEANSLVGLSPFPSFVQATALENGHYVVASPSWSNAGLMNLGAATWCDGNAGRIGKVSAANSLVGTATGDQVGKAGVTPLKNGNYVVRSDSWNHAGRAEVGAATWCNGTRVTAASVSPTNSLIGETAFDHVGEICAALENGHYVVGSPDWDRGSTANAGAATWCNGSSGRVGKVGIANSLVGMSADDQVGGDILAISDASHYIVSSDQWDNQKTADAGAVTWANGATGIKGEISAANSLVGTNPGDRVGAGIHGSFWGPDEKDYVVMSRYWRNGSLAAAGAATWCDGTKGTVGPIQADISVLGRIAGGGESLTYSFWKPRDLLIVGQPDANLVSILNGGSVPEPEIAVQQPAGSNLVDGKTRRSMGTTKRGKVSAAKVFTIRNTGKAPLTGLALSVTGTHRGDFLVEKPRSRTLAPGASTTFKVRFKPRATGNRSAVIRIASNDVDENPFDIPLTGRGAK